MIKTTVNSVHRDSRKDELAKVKDVLLITLKDLNI